MITDTKFKDDKRMNDNILMLIFSLPYLYDFSVGIVSVVFLGRIAEFNDSEKLLKKDVDEERKNLLQAVSYNSLQIRKLKVSQINIQKSIFKIYEIRLIK